MKHSNGLLSSNKLLRNTQEPLVPLVNVPPGCCFLWVLLWSGTSLTNSSNTLFKKISHLQKSLQNITLFSLVFHQTATHGQFLPRLLSLSIIQNNSQYYSDIYQDNYYHLAEALESSLQSSCPSSLQHRIPKNLDFFLYITPVQFTKSWNLTLIW